MKFVFLLFFSLLQVINLQAQDIYAAARTNNIALMDSLSAVGVAINAPNEKGYTALILAVYNDHKEAASWLLAHGAAVDAQDLSGNTALMGASFKGNMAMVKLLLAQQADVNMINFNFAAALHFAATFGQDAVARYLLDHGADKNLKDIRGLTAYEHARLQENQKMMEILVVK